MNKNSIRWYISLAIIAIVYSVVVFAIPFPKTSAVFWLSYLFTMAALGIQIHVMHVAFSRGQGIKSKFYGFPIARIGVCYLIVQFDISSIFIAMTVYISIPMWLPLVLYIVLLSAAAVGFIAADAARDEVVRQDVKLKQNVSNIQSLQSKVTSLIGLTQDATVNNVLTKFAENLRFSDPVSNVALQEVEADLKAHVDDLQRAIMDGDGESAVALVRRAEATLVERNNLCKLNK